LGAPALVLLKAAPRLGPWVTPDADPEIALPSWRVENAWKTLRKTSGVPDSRLHDFRHTSGTYAAQAGYNAFLVRDLLGHKTLAMTARYVGRDINPLRAVADRVAGRVAGAMAGRARGAPRRRSSAGRAVRDRVAS
jgi:integrase